VWCCCSAAQAGTALDAIREILASLGLECHPGKTKVVDLSNSREGLDFLGCHFHTCMSGRLWEQKRIIRYYLHCWPSQAAMKRLRAKIRDRTGRSRAGTDIRDVIARISTRYCAAGATTSAPGTPPPSSARPTGM
jgi:RNA-directed DNA polymerase